MMWLSGDINESIKRFFYFGTEDMVYFIIMSKILVRLYYEK